MKEYCGSYKGLAFQQKRKVESFSSHGWEVINMTQYLSCIQRTEICYVNITLITDYDAGLEGK